MSTPTAFTDAELLTWAQSHESISPMARGIIRLMIERDTYKSHALDAGQINAGLTDRVAAQSELLGKRAARRPSDTAVVPAGEIQRAINRAVAEADSEGGEA